jgi:putative addiction module killer protein
MLPYGYMGLKKIIEYEKDGTSYFEKWFQNLTAQAAAKVTTALYKMEMGNLSNVKAVGKGVSEYKIDFGPGYRIYFAGMAKN